MLVVFDKTSLVAPKIFKHRKDYPYPHFQFKLKAKTFSLVTDFRKVSVLGFSIQIQDESYFLKIAFLLLSHLKDFLFGGLTFMLLRFYPEPF